MSEPLIKRINVPVTPATVEAVQRLIELGDRVATARDVDGATVEIHYPDGLVEVLTWTGL